MALSQKEKDEIAKKVADPKVLERKRKREESAKKRAENRKKALIKAKSKVPARQKRYNEDRKKAKTAEDRLRLLLQIEAGLISAEELPPSFEGWVDQNLAIEDHMNIMQIKKALKGDAKAYEMLMDRAHGKATQRVEQTSETNVNIKPIQWLDDPSAGLITDQASEAEIIEDNSDEL